MTNPKKDFYLKLLTQINSEFNLYNEKIIIENQMHIEDQVQNLKSFGNKKSIYYYSNKSLDTDSKSFIKLIKKTEIEFIDFFNKIKPIAYRNATEEFFFNNLRFNILKILRNNFNFWQNRSIYDLISLVISQQSFQFKFNKEYFTLNYISLSKNFKIACQLFVDEQYVIKRQIEYKEKIELSIKKREIDEKKFKLENQKLPFKNQIINKQFKDLKKRYFYASNIKHQNGKETWSKLFVLSENGILYCEYLDFMQPRNIILKYNFDSFKAEDYKWSGFQSIIEIDENTALNKKLIMHQNWIYSYINKTN